MSATISEIPAWDVSTMLVQAERPDLIDLFFRINRPILSREGDRLVLTIPPKTPGEFPDAYISQPGASLDAFCADITLTRVMQRVRKTQERAA